MSDIQLFSNNAKSTLVAETLAASNTFHLASSAGFHAPVAGQYELATLSNADGTLIEIVRVSDNTANVLTVVRAQEGTTALDWPVGTLIDGRITAGTMARLAQGFDTSGNARGINAIDLQSGRNAPDRVASGEDSTAVGHSNIASGAGSTCIGGWGLAIGDDSLVLGTGGTASGYGAVVIGPGIASGSVCMILGDSRNRVDSSIMTSYFPVVKMDDYDDGSEQYTSANEFVMCSPYFDLAAPPPWAASTAYTQGAVVTPTTPDGFQYRLVMPDDITVLTTKQALTSGATEPTWPAVPTGSISDGIGTWVCQQPSAGYAMQPPPLGTIFVPTQLGFICHGTFSALTGTPAVSVGVVGDTTRYVNTQNVSISAAHGVHTFTGTPSLAVQATEQLVFTLNTAATAGRCVGRFFAKGFFVELPDHA